MDNVESLKLLKITWAMWPHMELDDIRAAVFHEAMKEENYLEACQAVIRLLRESRSYPPTPGEIIAEINRFRAEQVREKRRAEAEEAIRRRKEEEAQRAGRMPSPEQAREIAAWMRERYPELFSNEEEKSRDA